MDWTIADYVKHGAILNLVMTALTQAKKDGAIMWWCMNPKLVEAFMKGKMI